MFRGKTLHENFVIVPADKTSKNDTFDCKRYHVSILVKELWLNSLPGNQVYPNIYPFYSHLQKYFATAYSKSGVNQVQRSWNILTDSRVKSTEIRRTWPRHVNHFEEFLCTDFMCTRNKMDIILTVKLVLSSYFLVHKTQRPSAPLLLYAFLCPSVRRLSSIYISDLME